jgi:pimeloyl-ACP methyl ester carboxylesterase
MALVLVLAVGYLIYVGYRGSEVFGAHDRAGDCRTPASAFGWPYEAINYDINSDRELSAFADQTHCPTQGEPAGSGLTASDGTRIAGWYIPSANAGGPTAPTVVLAHAEGKNKSEMLAWAEPLHAAYNLVAFDFRNHGQSSGETTTLGVREVRDLEAVMGWIQATRGPAAIAVLGVGMGGAAAIDEAASDARVGAVIADSTHATLANALQAQLERDGFPLALPGAWSILLGGLLRTGEDMSSADPLQAIARYGGRPLLIVAAGHDGLVGPNDPADMLAAARGEGARVELETCAAAEHGKSIETCPTEYASWVLGFLGRALQSAP